jgi:hypothetical protein
VARWLPGLRGPAPLEVKGAAERRMTSVRGGGTPGQPWERGDWWVDKAITEGFQVNPWIYRCVHKKAQAALKHPVVVRYLDPDQGEVIPINRDPTGLTRRFNVQANPWERGKMFRYRLWCQRLLSPRGVFVEVTRSYSGGVAMLDLWEPDLTEIIPAANYDRGGPGAELANPAGMPPGWADPIHSFRLQLSSGGYDTLPRYDPDADALSQPRSILWLRSPHPTMLHRGVAPVTAAALSADLDQHARIYNRRYLENDGRPGGLVMLKGSVTPETMDAIRTRFESQQRAGRTMVVNGDAMEYVDLSTHPRDAQWENTRKATKEEILMVFGVPESVAGNASGRTFDNADAEWGIFWEDMAEDIATIDDQVDILTGGYDDDLFARHDLTDNWFLNRHRREAEDREMAAFEGGISTINDVRKARGQDPLDTAAARALWIPAGKVPVADPAHPGDQEELAKLAPVGTPATDPGAAAQAGAEQGAALGGRVAGNVNAARSLQLLAGKAAAGPGELEGKQGGGRSAGQLGTGRQPDPGLGTDALDPAELDEWRALGGTPGDTIVLRPRAAGWR